MLVSKKCEGGVRALTIQTEGLKFTSLWCSILHYGVSEGLPAELMNAVKVLIMVTVTVLESLLLISCYNARHLVACKSSS